MADTYDPVEQRARFAVQFQDTTNLDQRRRYQADITEAKTRHEQRLDQEYEGMQRRNPALMNAETGRQQERRMAEEGFQKSQLANERLNFDIGKEQRATTLAQKRLLFEQSREERAMRKEQLDLDAINREEDDTLAVQEKELELRQKALPGSSAYQRGVLEIFMQHPNAKKEFRESAMKNSGFSDPEEAWKQATDAVESGAARATVKTPGGVTATFVSPKPDKPESPGRMDALRTKIAKEFEKPEKDRDADYLGYLQGQFEAEKGKGASAATPGAVPPQVTKAPDLADPEQFKKAFQDAAPGTILMYKGTQWRKP